LADPGAAPGALAPDYSPFAKIAAEVLLRLGGDYARLIRVPGRAATAAASTTARELPAEIVNSIGMKFVLVPRGTFWMGGEGGQPGTRQETVTHDFYLGAYQVTQG